MTLSDDMNLEEFVMTNYEFSGADIKVRCTEAGLLALYNLFILFKRTRGYKCFYGNVH
ncbi:hypothetical protein MKX01_000872 [Papaver californicum]|nr:hypothetical protein MKX01_000872 [Papaver californicum]